MKCCQNNIVLVLNYSRDNKFKKNGCIDGYKIMLWRDLIRVVNSDFMCQGDIMSFTSYGMDPPARSMRLLR